MRIAVVGTGYVGLVSGSCLSEVGHQVTCIDLDKDKIEALRNGRIPIFEPGLEPMVRHNAEAGRLRFTSDLTGPVAEADVVLIAVGTPARPGDGHADLSHVYAAVASVARAVKGFTVIATKSTVPVGTGDEIERIIRETNPAADIAVVSNPEFLREGAAIQDFRHPDRVVVGMEDERARAVMAELYRPLYANQGTLMFTERRTAELIKYSANAFLAMKITFINEVADLCEKTGANVEDVARGIGLDERIGVKFLYPGPGFGGSCFPKDTLALAKTGQDYESPLRLVETTIALNEQRKHAMGRKVIAACGGTVRGKTIGILGLTFKPDTDDMRDAPSIAIIQSLRDAGARVRAFDPQGMETARAMMPEVEYARDEYELADKTDCLVLVTEWSQFRSLNLRRLKRAMRVPRFVDLRNLFARGQLEEQGFSYFSIGRPDLLGNGVAEAAE